MERKKYLLYITSLLALDLMTLEPSYYVSFIAWFHWQYLVFFVVPLFTMYELVEADPFLYSICFGFCFCKIVKRCKSSNK